MTIIDWVRVLVWPAVATFAIVAVGDYWGLYLVSAYGEEEDETASFVTLTIPDDLQALALSENEKWAQDATLEAIRERYDRLADWNKVRRAMGVAEVHE